MIIDAHTHFFPPEVSADPRAWAKSRGESHWADLVAPLKGKSLQGWATPDQMLKAMDEAGVDQAVLLGWYWEQVDNCRWQNRLVAEILKNHPRRFLAFAACNPTAAPEQVVDLLEEAREAGFCGVGELLPQVQGHDFKSPGMIALLEFCHRHRWPINFHVTEPVGHPYPGRVETPLEALVELATEFPENTFIFAHLGGLLPFYELNPRVALALRNVSYDTAACPLLYQPKSLALAMEVVGPEKILWGTDFPLRIFPSTQPEPDFKTYLRTLQTDEDLNPSALKQILGGNLEAILNPS